MPASHRSPNEGATDKMTETQLLSGPTCGTCRSRKVKCDRAKPSCRTCRRSCLTCVYGPKPGSARSRAYHEKELKKSQLELQRIRGATYVEDRSRSGSENGVSRRYEVASVEYGTGLEKEMKTGVESVREAERGTRTATGSPADLNAGAGAHGDGDGDGDSDSEASPESIKPVSNGMVVHFHGGSSKFYGIGSTVNQISELTSVLGNASLSPASSTASSNFHGSSGLEALRKNLFRNSLRDPHRVPVVRFCPERVDVERALVNFFRRDCVLWPLYAEESIRAQLRVFYQTPDKDRCPATAIGAWYIVSETLRLAVSEHECLPQDDASGFQVMAIKQSLRESLDALDAACADYASTLEQIKPSIIDVQALTIAVKSITALHHGRNADSRRILETACLLAKSIGLHQAPRQTDVAGRVEEDLWIFWCLYILDKMNLISGGDSCLLPSLNCGVPFPSKPSTASPETHRLRMARIQLAGIHEQIYTHLYSVEASRRPMSQRQESVIAIAADLKQWASSYLSPYTPLHSSDGASIFTALHAGTRYLHEDALCLIWRASGNAGNEQKLVEAARRGCSLVMDSLSTSKSYQTGREAREIFSRINATAAAPILALFRFAMCGPDLDTQNDIHLLRRCLSDIVSYVEQTGIVTKTCDLFQIAVALEKELEQKLASIEQPSYPPSTTAEASWIPSSLAHIMDVGAQPNSSKHVDTNLMAGLPSSMDAARAVAALNSVPTGAMLPTTANGIDPSSLHLPPAFDDSAFAPSPTSPVSRGIPPMSADHSLYPTFESTLNSPYMADIDQLVSMDNAMPSGVDWGDFDAQ